MISTDLSRECARPGCGERFILRQVNQQYHSKACAHNTTRTNKRAEFRNKTCVRCHTPFTAEHTNRKRLCPECDKAEMRRRKDHVLQFIAIDGEGSGYGTDHKYTLLGCGDQQIENLEGLQWWEVLNFLYSQFQRNPSATYVGFFLGYDFSQWIKTLPWDRARKLLTTEGQKERRFSADNGHTKYRPVHCTAPDGTEWEIKMLGDKRIEFRPRPGTWQYIKADSSAVFSDLSSVGARKLKKPDAKRFKVPAGGEIKLRIRRRNSSGWMYVCDSGPFFQCSLLSAISPKRREKEKAQQIVTPEEYAIVEEGKRLRGKDEKYRILGIPWFDELTEAGKTAEYNNLENAILPRLLSELNEGYVSAGIKLSKSQWFGPGQGAQEWLRNSGIPTREEIEAAVPEWFRVPAQKSYFGGWFEIFAHGIIPGTTYEYDINSAYPYIISKLPCLLHGHYSKGDNYGRKDYSYLPALPNKQSVRLVYAEVGGSHPRIGTMLHRRIDQSIRRPYETEGWFWQHELEAAQRAGIIDSIEYIKWITYKPCSGLMPTLDKECAHCHESFNSSDELLAHLDGPCWDVIQRSVNKTCRPPLRGVTGLYDNRIKVGKGSPRGKAYKLTYNSMYGKFAQSIAEPLFANAVYASLITAGCRAMILDAIATHPEGANAVVMVATDGVYFTSPHPGLPDSTKLGEWEAKKHENLTLFKPGVYWDDESRETIAKGEAPQLKSRGINAAAFAKVILGIDEKFIQWEKIGPPGTRVQTGPKSWREVKWPEVRFPVSFSMKTCKQALAIPQDVDYEPCACWRCGKARETGDEAPHGHGPSCDCSSCKIQRRNWHTAGKVTEDLIRTDSSDPTQKRNTSSLTFDGRAWWSKPYHGILLKNGKPEFSIPYDKSFGAAAQVAEGLIDPNLHGLTPDGSVDDIIWGAVGTGQFGR